MHRFECSSPPLGMHRAVAVITEQQVSPWREEVCSFLPKVGFYSSVLKFGLANVIITT